MDVRCLIVYWWNNHDYEVGDLMILEDHICLIPNPLIGENLDELGPRFPSVR